MPNQRCRYSRNRVHFLTLLISNSRGLQITKPERKWILQFYGLHTRLAWRCCNTPMAWTQSRVKRQKSTWFRRYLIVFIYACGQDEDRCVPCNAVLCLLLSGWKSYYLSCVSFAWGSHYQIYYVCVSSSSKEVSECAHWNYVDVIDKEKFISLFWKCGYFHFAYCNLKFFLASYLWGTRLQS